MKKLKDNGQWDDFVDSHASNSHMIHMTHQQFLPWHRIFILKFEDKLRGIDSSVELPYWRWIGTREIPDGWDQKLFGWMGVSRAVSHKGKNLPTASDVEKAIAKTSFQSFSDELQLLHNKVHDWVGGTMANLMKSPKDPLFWFHHAYCDKLFERWTIEYGVQAVCGRITNIWDLQSPYSSYSINEVTDGTSLGYQYTDMSY